MEIWRDITGYEGIYQVSNLGRVKSLNYGRTGKEKILKTNTDKRGYLRICLCKDGKRKTYRVHRLVLPTFNPVENMEQLEVNHIDENKENNKLSNLEWCTSEYNSNYGTRNKRISEANNGKLGVKNSTAIPIVQLDLEGNLINVYGSSMDAERNGFNHSAINQCIKGKRKTHGGYKWMKLSEYIANMHPNIKQINLFEKTYNVNQEEVSI